MYLISVIWKLILEYLRIKPFNADVLFLIVPDSAHAMCTPITLGTPHRYGN